MRYWRLFSLLFLLTLGVVLLGTHDAASQDLPQCSQTLLSLYTLSSDACGTGPVGYICNGGSSPQVQPEGQVSNAMAPVGALVETGLVDGLQTVPIITQVTGGGVMWMRHDDPIRTTKLLLGDVNIRDVSPPDFPAWTSFVVQTGIDRPDCPNSPHNTVVLQSWDGASSRVVVNGASLSLSGTVVVRTIENRTYFVGLKWRSALIVYGFEQPLWTGQQIVVPHVPGDFSQPGGPASQTTPLDTTLIEHLPTGLLDTPLWLPQPGYVATEGLVNMRSEPSLDGALIGQVPAGEILTIIGTNPTGDWYHVALSNGVSGWMFGEILQRNTGLIESTYSATPQPPQRYGVLSTIARVNAPAGANLREAPGSVFPVIGGLPDGAEVNLLARSPYNAWVKVEAGGQIGWLALIVVDTRANLEALPIDNDVPPPPAPTTPPGSSGNAFPDPNIPGV